MRYCKRCVQPDTRPGIKFDENGVCPPCLFMEYFNEIDWDSRKRDLDKIVEFGRSKNISGYDCIIGVSGGKDSTRQAMYVKDVLKMKPLLVCCTYPPEQVTDRGAQNIANLISLGFDAITVSPAAQAWKKMVRKGFLKYGNWAKSTEMALYASLPRVAIAYQIPLVFLGENPAIHFGELGVKSTNWDANRSKYSNTIASGPDTFLGDDITEEALICYRYPTDEEMVLANLQIVYLGYFWKDFTKVENGAFSVANGIEIRNDLPDNIGGIHPFDALDDDFVIVNQMIKYLKFGFGKVNDEVCELVRWGKIPREKAVDLVNKYDGKCSDYYVKKFCDYIDITETEFWQIAESYRNKDIWEKDAKGNWQLKVKLQ